MWQLLSPVWPEPRAAPQLPQSNLGSQSSPVACRLSGLPAAQQPQVSPNDLHATLLWELIGGCGLRGERHDQASQVTIEKLAQAQKACVGPSFSAVAISRTSWKHRPRVLWFFHVSQKPGGSDSAATRFVVKLACAGCPDIKPGSLLIVFGLQACPLHDITSGLGEARVGSHQEPAGRTGSVRDAPIAGLWKSTRRLAELWVASLRAWRCESDAV